MTRTHRLKIGYTRTRRQTQRKKIINKQKQIIRKRFSKFQTQVPKN